MARFAFLIIALMSVSLLAGCTNADNVTSGQAPILSALTEVAGPASGGNQITLTGVGFQEAQPLVINFGANEATIDTIVSNTEVLVTVPAGTAGTMVDVSVMNGNGVSTLPDIYSYSPLGLSALAPSVGSSAGGTMVTFTGVGFMNGALSVTFGGVDATMVMAVSDTEATAIAPAGAAGSTVDVALTNDHGTALLANAFVYDPFLATTINPPNGNAMGGTPVTITGVGFLAAPPMVTFGANMGSNVMVTNDTTLTVETPPGTPGSTVDVTVSSTAGTATMVQSFSYDPFLVFSVAASNGPAMGGNTVQVNGVGFSFGTAAVMFGADMATNVNVLTDGSLMCDVPAGIQGTTVGVSVTNDLGTATLINAYTYDAFAATSLDVPNGPVAGGETLTLTGTGFSTGGPVMVNVGGNPAQNITVVNDTTITFDTPAGPMGQMVDITVTNGNGMATLAQSYTFDSLNLTGLDVSMGPAAGGNPVTLVGTGLDNGVPMVMFGANPAMNITVLSDDGVVCDAPAGLVGTTVDVWIINANGSAVLRGSYTYQ